MRRRPTGVAVSTEWMEGDIPCREVRGIDFTSDEEFDMRAAKRVCVTRCHVRRECLDYAITRREYQGVWGGLTPDERRELTAKVGAR